MRAPITLVGLIMASACTGGFSVLEEADTGYSSLPGIPFQTSSPFRRTGTYTKHTKLGSCVPAKFEEIVALPVGPIKYVSLDGAKLSKSSLTMKYNDRGVLTEFSFNSEPAGSESVGSAVDALSTLLPFVGVTADTVDDAAAAGADGPACNTEPSGVEYYRF